MQISYEDLSNRVGNDKLGEEVEKVINIYQCSVLKVADMIAPIEDELPGILQGSYARMVKSVFRKQAKEAGYEEARAGDGTRNKYFMIAGERFRIGGVPTSKYDNSMNPSIHSFYYLFHAFSIDAEDAGIREAYIAKVKCAPRRGTSNFGEPDEEWVYRLPDAAKPETELEEDEDGGEGEVSNIG